jgi:hypothetical protein
VVVNTTHLILKLKLNSPVPRRIKNTMLLRSSVTTAAVLAGWFAIPATAHVAREASDDGSCRKTTVAIL